MRLSSFRAAKIVGLDLVEVSGLSDVVVLAGPNGVGKTRLLQSLIGFFQNPQPNANIALIIEATSTSERTAWGKQLLCTSDQQDAAHLRTFLQRPQRRNRYRSTVLNFESDRAITQIKPFAFSWEFADPFEEDIGWNFSYGYLRDRFQDVRDSLFKIVEGQRRKLADKAVQLKAEGAQNMPLDFRDPLEQFKTAFERLLAPKSLVNVNLRQQQILYEYEGQKLPIETLSSGEREVVNIVFDFLLRNPSDCIVFFDEPELHLHPELSYKLLQTLSAIGQNNQFIFCTHSPEIITASIENSVVFLTPRKSDGSNQALLVNRDDATHHALNLLGQSIGIISLGKKLLLIEGQEASLDKQTYGAILQNEFPELVLVPVGGKSTIRSFDEIRESVLNRTIWGVDFFMLCDRDAAMEIGEKSLQAHMSERLRMLPRYHLENYFLDEDILALVFAEMEPAESWLRDQKQLSERLRSLAAQTVPLATALRVAAAARENVGNINIMPKGINTDTTADDLVAAIATRIEQEKARVAASIDTTDLERLLRAEYDRLRKATEDASGLWKKDIPGRIVFNRFAGLAQIKTGRLKTLYLRKAQESKSDPFAEIREIFRSFRNIGR
jgi:predicted ATP-binding protein involved in virulence